MREFWREAGLDERIVIVGAIAVFVEFIVGFSYLHHLAAHLDALDAMRK
jgi:hypothetical protein